MQIPMIHPEQNQPCALLQPSGCGGQMEAIARWFAQRQNSAQAEALHPATILFAADHGVYLAKPERISTRMLLERAVAPDSLIRELAMQADCALHFVDVGVKGSLAALDAVEHAKVRRAGSADIRSAAAMTQADYWEAVGIGETMAKRAIHNGANLLVAGTLASGDRVAVAALSAALTGLPPEAVLTPDATDSTSDYTQDLIAVEQALQRAQGTPSHDLLMALGGLELAAVAGLYRAAAQSGVPILIDGLASAAAALAASAWDVRITGWMLASHLSNDGAHRALLDELGLEALVELKHSVDGGKVATLLLPMLQSAIALQHGLTRIEAQAT